MAYDVINADDPRPLLVLRECTTCSGTDDALLSRTEDNERTILLSRWFRCVKLAPDVLENDRNAFHSLFQGAETGGSHLFVVHNDGAGRRNLDGAQSRRELWQNMEAVLDEAYDGKSDRALKDFQKVLASLDQLDERVGMLELKLDREIERRGPTSSKLKKIRRDLAKATAQRNDVLAQCDEITKELELKPRPKDAAPQEG